MILNYQEALAYIYSFTDYERGDKYTRDRNENLLRERTLLERLGNPHQQYTNTLIAGTKGKGSTATYIERVLREAGVHTGLYTQPDLHTFRERAQVNGHLISEEEVGELIPEIRAATEQISDTKAIWSLHHLRNRHCFGASPFCSSARPACSDRGWNRWTSRCYQCDPSLGLGNFLD